MSKLQENSPNDEAKALPPPPPPPYQESTTTPSQPSSSLPKAPAPAPAPAPRTSHPQPASPVPRQFPPSFGIYTAGFMSRHYTLGEHRSQPLYFVGMHSGLFSDAPVTLHSGPSDSHPPLATLDFRTFSNSLTVSLPPPPGSRLTAAEERVPRSSSHGMFGPGSYRFEIELGDGRTREAFEWRHSSGDTVKSLGGSRGGWKLVRMSKGPPPAGAATGGSNVAFVAGGPTDKEGREVVAVWSEALGRVTKAALFEFLGSGATGILGERWAIMAVITGLGIFQKQQHRKHGAGAAGGA